MELAKNEIKIGDYAVSIMARNLYGEYRNLTGAYPTKDTYRFLLDLAVDLIDANMYSKTNGFNATAECQYDKYKDIRKALINMKNQYEELCENGKIE